MAADLVLNRRRGSSLITRNLVQRFTKKEAAIAYVHQRIPINCPLNLMPLSDNILMSLSNPTSVLFVCMGNICRSPTAEGYFRHHLAQAGSSDRVAVDSAGTHGYHVGHPPDPRATQTAARRGIDLSALRARRVVAEDFQKFDLIIAMDEDNLRLLRELDPGDGAELALMLQFGASFDSIREVPDPYYGGQGGFEHMCDLLDEATAGLLDRLLNSAE